MPSKNFHKNKPKRFEDLMNKKIKKLKKKYFIIDFSKYNKFKKDINSHRISIGKFGEIIKLIKEKWIKFYKRGFVTGLMVLSLICLIDQVLQTPFFFNKINSDNFLLSLSFIFFGSVFCGIISFIFLIVLSIITVPKN